LANDLFYLSANCIKRDGQRLKGLCCNAFAFVDEAKQNVLGTNVRVIEKARLFLGKHNNPAGTICKAFKHVGPPHSESVDIE
jgi:hypothetical protein